MAADHRAGCGSPLAPERKGGAGVKLAGMVSIATAAVAAVLLTAFAPPAIAQAPPDSVVYFPLGNGATYSCSGGPPFVVNNHHHYSGGSSPGNCAIQQIGPPPVGLACDVPTAITFTHEMHPWTTEAWLCQQQQYGGQTQYGIGAQEAAPTAGGDEPAQELAQTGGAPLVSLAGGAVVTVLLLGGALLLSTRRPLRRRR